VETCLFWLCRVVLRGALSAKHTTHVTTTTFRKLVGQCIAMRAYIDGSQELKGACKALGILRDVATPRRPQTNGVAERAVRRVLEGTRALLLARGLLHH
jgi:hypothetical protein